VQCATDARFLIDSWASCCKERCMYCCVDIAVVLLWLTVHRRRSSQSSRPRTRVHRRSSARGSTEVFSLSVCHVDLVVVSVSDSFFTIHSLCMPPSWWINIHISHTSCVSLCSIFCQTTDTFHDHVTFLCCVLSMSDACGSACCPLVLWLAELTL